MIEDLTFHEREAIKQALGFTAAMSLLDGNVFPNREEYLKQLAREALDTWIRLSNLVNEKEIQRKLGFNS